MPQEPAEVWDEIARQYQAGIVVSGIAKTFNVSRVRIRLQAERFGWTRGTAEGGAAVSPEENSGAAPQVGADAVTSPPAREGLFDRHRGEWEPLYELRADAYRILRGETPRILAAVEPSSVLERIDLAKDLLALAEKDAKALMMAQEGERRAHGLDYKQQQEAQTEDEAQARRRRELVASVVDFVSRLRSADGAGSSERAQE
ncbi:hypothetical protein ILT44_24360 [Microvirga sp. BT689]|uniref:hypothetical protein n=1 Tax=Microvirga arvi TaxID=2778731 RepID=UPI0019521E17|nr:hypothetical protein [Microvirga arvi]MBM6583340.1 hypothetical protein [Microvirga arvi]